MEDLTLSSLVPPSVFPTMTRRGLSDAPQELIDEIIDHCSGDKKTLIACSLTCRAWVYRTRRHLFSKLTLTEKTLPVWCGVVVTPTTGSRLQLPFNSCHPPSLSSTLSSHITSLQLVPTYSQTVPNNLGVNELLQAKPHLSAFTQLKSLTLTAISFSSFDDASLEACFGSLAETVHELKLSMCFLGEHRLTPLLRLFNRLEALVVDGNVWYRTPTRMADGDLPIFRGSFAASGFTGENDGLLDYLTAARLEYHTITLGYNPRLTLKKSNALLAKCKNHLKKLSLLATEWAPPHLCRLTLFISFTLD